MTIKELSDRVQQIDVFQLMRKALVENEQKIVEMNREQMEVGVTSKGQTIDPTYRSAQYAQFKKKIGSRSPVGIPNLKLTGSFHEKMQMEIDDRSYSIYSTDDKERDLTAKYKDIFGLNAENIRKAQEINTRKLGQLYKQATGL